jgi:hypothetical protein
MHATIATENSIAKKKKRLEQRKLFSSFNLHFVSIMCCCLVSLAEAPSGHSSPISSLCPGSYSCLKQHASYQDFWQVQLAGTRWSNLNLQAGLAKSHVVYYCLNLKQS